MLSIPGGLEQKKNIDSLEKNRKKVVSI